MNILFTSDLSGMGGGETSMVNLCGALKSDHKIIALCAVTGDLVTLLEKMGIKVYVMDYRNKTTLALNLLRIRRIAAKEHIEVIHSNDPLTSVIMYYAVCGLHVQTYWTCHGQWYDFKGIRKWLIKKSNKHVFCVSAKVQESLQKMGFRNTSITYQGIPLEKYKKAAPANLREHYGIRHETALIACVGRFQPIKGQLKLVRALCELIRKGYDIVCLFVGGCIYNNEEESDYYSKVRSFVIDNHLEKSLIFTGVRKDVPGILKEIDCLVVPSDNESFGMAAIEALAAGTPVLSTPNDGVSEILEYREEYIARSNDVQGLSALIEKFLTEYKVDNKAAEFASRRCEDFSIEHAAEKYMCIFER